MLSNTVSIMNPLNTPSLFAHLPLTSSLMAQDSGWLMILLYILLPVLLLILIGFFVWRFLRGKKVATSELDGFGIDGATEPVSDGFDPNALNAVDAEPELVEAVAVDTDNPEFVDFNLGEETADTSSTEVAIDGFDLAAPENAEFDSEGEEQQDLLHDMQQDGKSDELNFGSDEIQLEDSSEAPIAAEVTDHEASDGELDLNLEEDDDEFDMVLEDDLDEQEAPNLDLVADNEPEPPLEFGTPGSDKEDTSDHKNSDQEQLAEANAESETKQPFQPHDEFDLARSSESDEFDLSDDTEQGFDTDMEGLSLEDSGDLQLDSADIANADIADPDILQDENDAPTPADTAVGINLEEESEELESLSIEPGKGTVDFENEPTEDFPPVQASPEEPATEPTGDSPLTEVALGAAASSAIVAGTSAMSYSEGEAEKEPTPTATSQPNEIASAVTNSTEDQTWIAEAKKELEKLNRLNQDLIDDRTYLNQMLMDNEKAQADFDSQIQKEKSRADEAAAKHQQITDREEKLTVRVNELEATNQKLTDNSTKADTELVSLKSKAESALKLSTKLEAQTEKNAKLDAELEKASQQNESLTKQVAQLETEQKSLQTEIATALEKPSTEQTSLLSQLQSQLQSSQTSSTALENQIAKLSSEREELQRTANQAKEEVPETATAEIQRLELELKTQQDKKSDELNQLKKQLAESESELQQAKTKLDSSARDTESANAKNETKLDELKLQLESQEEQFAKLQAEVENTKSKAEKSDQLQSELEASKKKAEELTSKLSDAHEKSASLEQQLKQTTELELQVEQWKTKAAKLEGLQKELETAQQSLSNYEFELAEAKQSASESAKGREEELASLKLSLEKERKTTGTYELELSTYKAEAKKAAELETKNAELTDQQKQLKAEQAAAVKLAESNSTELAKAKSELSKTESQIADLKADREKLKSELKSAEERIQVVKKEASDTLAIAKKAAAESSSKTTVKKSSTKKTTAKKSSASKKTTTRKKGKKADDLTIVEGIGPKICELLKSAGIENLAVLGKTKPEKVREILSDAGAKFARHNPETWPRQADMAAKGEWEKLAEWQDKLDGGVDRS
jgi:predicted flap endonuclease-1-like 5' DNA nuclease